MLRKVHSINSNSFISASLRLFLL
uniref:Uncharacterized protein n=1 Tax=Arundo donax TaxID=35708 RepID=A0A0A9H2Q2_ARUDO